MPQHPGDEPAIERRYLHFLVEVGEILGESLDYTETLQRVCEAAVRTVGDIATMYLSEDESIEVVAVAHADPSLVPEIRARAKEVMKTQNAFRRSVASVIRNARPLLIENVDQATLEGLAANPDHAKFIRTLKAKSIIVVPLVSQSRGTLGALSLVCTHDSGLSYDGETLILAEDLGRRCGMAIAKARLNAVALDVSTRFQLAALPRTLPKRQGLKFDAYYEPASSEMLVGGDWYDAFALPDGRIGVSVGDVSGHGLQAAAFMGSLRDALRVALYLEADMNSAIRAADLLLREEAPKGMFATASLAILDVDSCEISCIAAGHPGPLIWRQRTNEVIDPFTERGLPLGYRDLAAGNPAPQTIDVRGPSLVAFFTDGLLEAKRDYLKGEAKLADALMDASVREATNPARELRVRCAPERHPDDIAVLTITFE